MPYASCRYAPPDATGMIGPELIQGENARIICTDDQGVEWSLTEDSQVGDWLRFIESGGTVEPAEEVIGGPGGPALPSIERDYGAEIDALEARVTALENAP